MKQIDKNALLDWEKYKEDIYRATLSIGLLRGYAIPRLFGKGGATPRL